MESAPSPVPQAPSSPDRRIRFADENAPSPTALGDGETSNVVTTPIITTARGSGKAPSSYPPATSPGAGSRKEMSLPIIVKGDNTLYDQPPSIVSSTSEANDEVMALRQRVAELEAINRKNSIEIETLLSQKKEYDLLREQSSKGFKSLRNNGVGDSTPCTPSSSRSGKDASYLSQKEIIFAAKSPRPMASSKGLPPIMNPSASDISLHFDSESANKDEAIKNQAAEILRLNEKLEGLQAKLQSAQSTPTVTMSKILLTMDSPDQLPRLDEVAILKESLSAANDKIAVLETQNRELQLKQEQFNELRQQSAQGFKMLSGTPRSKSIKVPRQDE
jgi:hypothetical protein